MNILIQPRQQGNQHFWQVQLDQHSVSFRTEAQARQFVATLQARLDAPHQLPNQPLHRQAS